MYRTAVRDGRGQAFIGFSTLFSNSLASFTFYSSQLEWLGNPYCCSISGSKMSWVNPPHKGREEDSKPDILQGSPILESLPWHIVLVYCSLVALLGMGWGGDFVYLCFYLKSSILPLLEIIHVFLRQGMQSFWDIIYFEM